MAVMSLPLLGVGLSYSSGVASIAEQEPGLVDFVEIEPQTLWYHTGLAPASYRLDREVMECLLALPCPKVLHGVGNPVGGSRLPLDEQTLLVADMAAELGAPWVSEHLSFNRAGDGRTEFTTGFLLPPRQTPEGVDAAITSIAAMAECLPVPLAVETGVNYLRPRPEELPDGQFVAAVAEGSDCGILLDLHNIWTNERNGRQPVSEFLDQIPLERVWEIHLAGGMERGGYWLDAHCGSVPLPLMVLTRMLLPRLPNLRAVVFELFPAFLSSFGLAGVRAELAHLRRLWMERDRSPVTTAAISRPVTNAAPSAQDEAISPGEWENALAGLVLGRDIPGPLARQLRKDPGIALLRELIEEFRASMVAATMKRTIRLLLLAIGERGLRRLLEGYWKQLPPQLFASAEAEQFAGHLRQLDLDVPFLAEIAMFERMVIATLLDGQSRVARFAYDPFPVLRALDEGRMPAPPDPGLFEIVLTGHAKPPEESITQLTWHH